MGVRESETTKARLGWKSKFLPIAFLLFSAYTRRRPLLPRQHQDEPRCCCLVLLLVVVKLPMRVCLCVYCVNRAEPNPTFPSKAGQAAGFSRSKQRTRQAAMMMIS